MQMLQTGQLAKYVGLGSLFLLLSGGVVAQNLRLELQANFERFSGLANFAPLQNLDVGTTTTVIVDIAPTAPRKTRPDLMPNGRGWNNAIKTIKIGAPFNITFNAAMLMQSDGMLAMVHDPLGNRDYTLKPLLTSTGEILGAAGSQSYLPLQFTLMQHGHQDQTLSVRDLTRDFAKLAKAKMLVRLKGKSPTATPLGLVFGVSGAKVSELQID